VFRLSDSGLELTEVAPGIEIERDIISKMPFAPRVNDPVEMDASIFRPEPMGLRDRLLDIHIDDRISYDASKNTLFLNFAGMRVRNEADLAAIKEAVDGTLAPLGKRVYSIVNYERFVADDDIIDKYMDLVKYVEEKYYISVSRYTNSGFLRLKLGKELGKRKVSSKVYESGEEAVLHLTDK
jgi:propionate CoA-transferase